HVGEQSLTVFIEGLERVAGDDKHHYGIPHGFDVGVLEACDHIAAVLDHGIACLTFTSHDRSATRTVQVSSAIRERIRTLLRSPVIAGRTSRTGRLEVLDGHRALKGKLWAPDGIQWNCNFKDEHRDVLAEIWLKTVTVIGTARPTGGQRGEFDVEAILLAEQEALPERAEESSFWSDTSLEELGERQLVGAVQDLNQLTALWPEDEPFEDALGELLADRDVRRRFVRQDGA
ncbi:MAG TPA: hypothetical protein VGB90_02010, partial [Alphaproteobacteria bacterium]